MSSTIDAGPIAFRIGQIDALVTCLVASSAFYSPEMRAALALRWLCRAWEQYRKDRAITLGSSLIGAEICGERNAFLTLLEHALPAREKPLTQAIRTVRKIAIRPMASEAADVVIMNDDLRRIPETIRLSRRTHAVLWQNIGLALGIKAIFLGLAVFGNATMWMAVFADMGASLIVVFNGLRLLRRKSL